MRSGTEKALNRIEERLVSLLKRPVRLVLTDNRRIMISARRDHACYWIRLHHMFLEASEKEIESLAVFVSGNREASRKAIDAFIQRHGNRIRGGRAITNPRRARVFARGRYRDLDEAFDRVNRTYFGGTVNCLITWGRRGKAGPRKSVRLGSYSPETRIIRIHPVLDRPFVPRYVIDSIVYHEMLHRVMDCRMGNNRRLYHHRAFKKREQAFARHEEARQWIKKNLNRLLA